MPNGEVINITSCDDGVAITVEGNMEKTVEKLNKFTEHHIIEIHCDSNEIHSFDYFDGAEIKEHTYSGGNRSKVIYFKTMPIENGSKTLEKGRDGIEYETVCPKCKGSGNDKETGYVFGLGYILCSECNGRTKVLK